MQVEKVNGNMKLRLSGPFFPHQHSDKPGEFKRRWGQCYTITPEDAIEERLARLKQQQKDSSNPVKLKVKISKLIMKINVDIVQEEIVKLLTHVMDENHSLAKEYKRMAQFYDEKKKECDQANVEMPQYRMVLLKKSKAIEEGANIPDNIHDHRLQMPTGEGTMQCAQVYFDPNTDKGPPAEKGDTKK
jgi:hypothetical protein